ncbi:hypothetical protein [Pelagibius sp. Alg239-R121]|uniref:hypothetical protein n=1 Tax=Pelagibius sp. Alg239-R121 TaxID=2993448 RepID=UPI0024A6530D|nr:hypothetical protein [Pelagibius sp. Alg239-R121]
MSRSLSEDLTKSIVAALEKSGNSAAEVPAAPKSSIADARKFLLMADADRFALLTLQEWKSETYVNTGLSFDLTLEVMSKDDTELGRTTLHGKDNLGSAALPKDVRIASETAIRLKLETLFNEPSLKAALE